MNLIIKPSVIKSAINYCFPTLIGAAAFLLVCNPAILNPKNIYWFSPWSDDPTTSYLGWAFFRNSSWAFPIGLNPQYGLELSSSIIFSDSIPIAAILFKPLSNFLPQPFQFLGLWLALCFLLQAYIGWNLVSLISKNQLFRLITTVIICMAPPFLHRINLHIALASQFLILSSLYLLFNKRGAYHFFKWFFLLAFTLCTHIYLFIMVGGIWLVDLITRMPNLQLKILLKCTLKATFLISGILVVAWILGYFQVDNLSLNGGGYGVIKLNLLSIFDSNGWSYFLPDIKTPPDFKEGFNYLGLGILLLMPFSMYSVARNRDVHQKILLQYKFFSIFLLLATLASLTNFVSIGTLTFSYPMPEHIINLGNIFRATGRFFWPVYYVIVISIFFYSIFKGYSKNFALTLLAIACVVQVADTKAGYQIIKTSMSFTRQDVLVTSPWHEIGSKYKNIVMVPIDEDLSIEHLHWSNVSLFLRPNIRWGLT